MYEEDGEEMAKGGRRESGDGEREREKGRVRDKEYAVPL